MSDIMRRLATVRKVDAIEPIEGADQIETAVFGGWKAVVIKGEFNPGDLAVYIEIDSWVPHELAPFLGKGRTLKTYKGVDGYRLRTVKLCGQISQGLALKPDAIPQFLQNPTELSEDVTKQLGINKWEPDLAVMSGHAKGSLPSYIRKTDLERVQNNPDFITVNDIYEAQFKADGTSCTAYVTAGMLGVAGRNVDWQLGVDEDKNLYICVCRDCGILDALVGFNQSTGRNIAVQGEIVGPGIQKNHGDYREKQFLAFDVWDIDQMRYLTRSERLRVFAKLREVGWGGQTVATYMPEVSSSWFGSMQTLIDSTNNICTSAHPKEEGLVFKSLQTERRFKVISNSYLLGEK